AIPLRPRSARPEQAREVAFAAKSRYGESFEMILVASPIVPVLSHSFQIGKDPFRGILDRLDADSRRQAMAEATEMLRKFYSEGRVRVPEIVILVTGVRPSNPPQRKSTRSAK